MHNIILKSTKKTVTEINIVNPEIPGLSAAQSTQSRYFGIGKFPGSRDSEILGLQSLVFIVKNFSRL